MKHFELFFNQLLSTQNVNVARFARNVKNETFFYDFQTLCIFKKYFLPFDCGLGMRYDLYDPLYSFVVVDIV